MLQTGGERPEHGKGKESMENLAPAGNWEALERADAAGADAVYLGYAAFSARAGAGNFDREELEEAIRYAHVRQMRVHVTVNTLVKDGELRQVTEVLRMLRDLHADAVLIQDLGVLRIARRLFPGLTVHASTQMAIHNRSGAEWCRGQGIRRVVLARECPLEEIRRCADTGVEIEAFAHGAQCVCVSGMCLFSSMVGERSGNRGRCAQPCRMVYAYRGRWGAWLSPRDLCLRDELPALARSGVTSIKTEGRLKRPEYVAVVAASYRKGLDSLAAGRFEPADSAEKEGLLQIYNRGGFMKGYALGCEDAGVIWPEGVNHRGVAVGRVEEKDGNRIGIRTERSLHDGDGIVVRNREGERFLTYSGAEVGAGGLATVRLRPGQRAAKGDRVFRLTDCRQMEEARAMRGRRVTVKLLLRAMPGEPLTLEATDGENTVVVAGERVEKAQSRPVTAEELVRNLQKTGGTVFEPGEVRVRTEGAFVPLAQVNGIRREALSALAEKRIAVFAPDTGGDGTFPEEYLPGESLPGRELPPMAVVRNAEQARSVREAGFRIVWRPEDYREEALRELMGQIEPGDWFHLPDVCEEKTLQMLYRLAESHRDRLGGVVLGSAGQLGLHWSLPRGAGSGIPVMNRQAASLLFEAGCSFVTASPELTGKELAVLLEGDPPIAVNLYGRTRLMLLHHCPARTAAGLTKGHRDCALCDLGDDRALKGQALEDRKGYRFPLLRQRLPEGCLVELMNALPTDVLDKTVLHPAIELTTEEAAEAREVAEAFAAKRKTGGKTTGGHWKRPVE